MRFSFGGPVGLDYSAVLPMAEAMGGLNDVLIEALPDVDKIVRWAFQKDD